MNQSSKTHHLIALFLIFIGIFARTLPHPENFTPLVAIALFAGAVLPRALALTVPLIAMIVSDLWIGPHELFWLTWGSFIFVTFIGFWVGRSMRWLPILLGSLSGSIFFFITSNLGVFFFQAMYPKNFSGLLECFWMALPFFRNSVLGDIFFCVVFFGIFDFSKRAVYKLSQSNA